MTKLIIQIPCYNEADTLPATLADLPRHLPGVDVVEWLVIDDGSTDATAELALALGVDHVERLRPRQGLARAFTTGLDACLRAGADIIVNTDADNQYNAADIPKLIAPILSSQAEIVVGARPIPQIAHFSPVKKVLQRVGSWAVRALSGTTVVDATSGFRAMSRSAANQLKVFSSYSYTLETIIQAGHKGIAIASVPIRTNGETRPSRLVKSVPKYVFRQAMTMTRIFMTYRPFFFFAAPGVVSFLIGFLIGMRFVYDYVTVGGAGHIQSLILAALLLGMGFILIIVGLLADLTAVNRKLLEGIDTRLRDIEASNDHGEASSLISPKADLQGRRKVK
jgi:glycosyltransferase involved in cell wall biosynthesis